MKKRIFTWMLTAVILFTGTAEYAAAAPVQPETATQEAAEQSETTVQETAEQPEEEKPIFPGGLKPMELLPAGETDPADIFEEDVDAVGKAAAAYSSYWDCYSTNYYYNMLNETQQALWDKLDQMCAAYLTGTQSLASSVDSEGNTYYPTKSFVVTELSFLDTRNIIYMFMYSNPQYYFLDTTSVRYRLLSNGYLWRLSVFPAFANGTARASETARMKGVIDNWMAQIQAQPDVLQKEKLAHDLICQKVVYDENYENINHNKYNQVAYSVFCTDSTVCAGYSQAMQLLMNGAGIDCAIVTSKEHEWNIIRLNGSWYYVDLTWDDQTQEQAALHGTNGLIGYQYFNRSKAQFAVEEFAQNAAMHMTEAFWDPYLPELTHDSNATWTDYGTIDLPIGVLAAPLISCVQDRVSLTAPAGGSIYYTIDGTLPSAAATRARKYTGSFTLSQAASVRAVAVYNGYLDSAVSEAYLVPSSQVTFHANGGYIGKKSTKSVTKRMSAGSKIGKLLSPRRKGYAFLGWFTKKSSGSKIASNTSVSGSRTYYAHWAKIKKAKASISSVKGSSGKLQVKVKKVKTASGYQIRYSLKQNMSSARTKTTDDTSVTIKGLKKKKKYYVQVRMYQKESVSGKKTYGSWSKVKCVTTKK